MLAGSEARPEHARALSTSAQRSAARTGAPGTRAAPEGVDLARTVEALGLADRANEEIAATGARPRRFSELGSTHSPRASGAWRSSRPTE